VTFGETIDVNVVNVDVFVTDRDGKSVLGLRKGDFQLFEDGKPIEISNFQELQARQADAPAETPAPGSEPTAASPAPAATANYIAVYFDDANTQPGHRARVLKQLREFLEKNVGPNDKVMIASYSLGLRVYTPFTSDRATLATALNALEARPATGGEMDRQRATALRTMLNLQAVNAKQGDPCGSEVKSPVESFAQVARDEALRAIKGLTILVNSLSGVPGRKTLLLFSDGIPLTPGEELNEAFIQMCGGGAAASGINLGDAPVMDVRGDPSQIYLAPVTPLDSQKYSVAKDLATLAAHANANRVSFYTVQAGGAATLAASSAGFGPDEALLRLPEITLIHTQNYEGALSSLASETGGKAIFNANQIAKDMGDLWTDLSTHYSLGFSTARKPDGRQHRIEVKVKQPKLRVRSLQSYRDKPVLERAVDRTLAALLYRIEDNPLEVTVEIAEPTLGEKDLYFVPVQLRIPLFKLGILNQDAMFIGNLRLLVATQAADGSLSPVRQVSVPVRIAQKEVLRAMGQYFIYNLTLQLKAGEQKLAVTIRDEVTGTASFLSRALTVGAAAAAVSAKAAH
jgi:VWFA-related protein